MFEKTNDISLIIGSSFVMPILLSAILIWFFISYQKKKYQYEVERKDAQLREQALEIERQNSIQSERNRIATEMHDELGSGLTIIKYLSDGVVTKMTDEICREDVLKIAQYSTGLVRNMSEIIWAMNSRFDNVEGLIGYIRRYAVEFLEDHKIDHSFFAEDVKDNINISGEKRRNVYLVIKELLNNAVKYSGASKIRIEAGTHPDLFVKIIESGGKGFDPKETSDFGNGLYNINKRLEQIGGKIHFLQSSAGMEISVTLPIVHEENFKTNQNLQS